MVMVPELLFLDIFWSRIVYKIQYWIKFVTEKKLCYADSFNEL